jgi:AraC family transcriptional regulator, regulatory protein of adaptative response / methylphosphotriester-DNA alkyltransferase methyltransferase
LPQKYRIHRSGGHPRPATRRTARADASALGDPLGLRPRTTGLSNRPTTLIRRRALFEEAAEIIEREYDRDLELEEVARRIATSRRQLQHAFAEVGGTSFRSYLASVRMRRALTLLRSGSVPVREVAMTVGYRQPAQFAKAFRRHHGVSPSSLRWANADGVAAHRSRALAV